MAFEGVRGKIGKCEAVLNAVRARVVERLQQSINELHLSTGRYLESPTRGHVMLRAALRGRWEFSDSFASAKNDVAIFGPVGAYILHVVL